MHICNAYNDGYRCTDVGGERIAVFRHMHCAAYVHESWVSASWVSAPWASAIVQRLLTSDMLGGSICEPIQDKGQSLDYYALTSMYGRLINSSSTLAVIRRNVSSRFQCAWPEAILDGMIIMAAQLFQVTSRSVRFNLRLLVYSRLMSDLGTL